MSDEGGGAATLEERVELLETGLEEQGRELKYVLRRLNRTLAGSGWEEPEWKSELGPRKAPKPETRTRPERVVPRTPEPVRVVEESRSPVVESEVGREERGSRFGVDLDLERLKSGEWWFGKIGIALLLFGVVFLFKFSWDQGWLKALLTPTVRVVIGLLIGSALISLGLKISGMRRAYAGVLMGGGIGTFYITGFAAFQVFGIVSYAVAVGFMVCVTVLAFVLSLRQSESALALIGVSGGLATPFVLYSESGSVGGLVAYTCGILAGAAATYLFKGWRSLLAFAGVGTWLVFVAAFYSEIYGSADVAAADRWALGLGAILTWLVLWLTPVSREVLRERRPESWSVPDTSSLLRWLISDEAILRSNALTHILSLSSPLLALFFIQGIWSLEAVPAGWICMGGAAVYALAAATLRNIHGGERVAYTQALVGVLLGTLAIVLLLDGDTLFFTLASEATVLHFVGRRFRDRVLTWEAHALFAVAAVWFAYRIVQGSIVALLGVVFTPESSEAFGIGTVVDVAVLALAFGASTAFPGAAMRVYRTLAHAGVVALVFREFLSFEEGGTYILCAWTLYALGLHLLSRHYPRWSSVVGAHVLAVLISTGLLFRLVGEYLLDLDAIVILDIHGLTDFAIIVGALGATRLVTDRAANFYRLAACGALSLWILRELANVDGMYGAVLLAWTVYAAALVALSRRFRDRGLLIAAHLQFVAVGLLLSLRLVEGVVGSSTGLPMIGLQSLVDLTAILVAAGVAWFVSEREWKIAYLTAAHLGMLAWLWQELAEVSSGDAFVSIAWGLYASALLVAGLRWNFAWFVRAGTVTLFVVVGKLFIWDLSGVEAIWRILLFLGFGSLFLALGYYLKKLWRPDIQTDESTSEERASRTL